MNEKEIHKADTLPSSNTRRVHPNGLVSVLGGFLSR